MSIRKRRRERARSRAVAQHQADAAVIEQCKREFNFSAATFNGTCCPHCKKPVPPRALFSITGYYGAVHLSACGIKPEYCHESLGSGNFRPQTLARTEYSVRRTRPGKFYSVVREQ